MEGRGNAVRLRHLIPIPRGSSLPALSEWLQREVDRHAAPQVRERFAEERSLLRAVPRQAFGPRRVRAVSVSRGAQVRAEGAWYSAPSRWAVLEAAAYIGVDALTRR